MRKITSILFFVCLISIAGYGQDKVKELLKEGINYHDKGEYDKAIEIYKKALKTDPKSPLINYEISFSYLQKKDYKNAIMYSDKVLKTDTKDNGNVLGAYIVKGSALDMLGQTQKSIRLFKEAIKKFKHYLLHYNLALNYAKINKYEPALEQVVKAINENTNHASSHFLLANIHNTLGNRTQTILASYYALLLESGTRRAKRGYDHLIRNLAKGVTKDKDKPNNIRWTIARTDSVFSGAELTLTMLAAVNMSKENKDKTQEEKFVETTRMFLSFMGETKASKKKPKDIWWEFYTPFFYKIAKSKHIETFAHFINRIGSEVSEKWLNDNEEKIKAFGEWLRKQ